MQPDKPKTSKTTQGQNEQRRKNCADERLSDKAGYGRATNSPNVNKADKSA